MALENPMITKERILQVLDNVKDPETPVINVLELSVVSGMELRHLSFHQPMYELLVNRRMA
jgi:metal-sulfur cluster biosynthetic enzyme